MADFTGSFSGSFTGSYDILTHNDQYTGATYGYVLHQRTGIGKAENILLSDFFRNWLGSESGSAGIQDYAAGGYIFDQDRILIRSGSFDGSTYTPIIKTATISNLFGGYNASANLRNTFIYARGVGRNTNSPSVSSSVVLTVGGQVLIDKDTNGGDQAGLHLTILNANDFSKVSTTRYDTTTSGVASTNLATAIDQLTTSQIAVLTSLGYWEENLNDNLRVAAKKVGLTKLGGYISTSSGSAYSAVFYGTSGSAGVGDSLERLVSYGFTTATELDIPTAVINTRVQSNVQNDYPFVNIAGANSTNALYAYNADTSSVLTPALFVDSDGNVTASGNMVISGSLVGDAVSSSYADTAATASYFSGSINFPDGLSVTGSFELQGSMSASGDITASAFVGDGTEITGVVSSSYALTASYALNAGGGSGNAGATGSIGNVAFFTGSQDISGSNALYWDEGNGRLGIGTTSPDGLLHISAGNSGDARLIIQADEDNNAEGDVPQIWFKADGDVTEGLIGLNNNYLDFVNNVNSTGGFRFYTGTTDNSGLTDPYTNATEKIRITPAGNVGIGTTSPSASLGNDGVVLQIGDSGVGQAGLLTFGRNFAERAGMVWRRGTNTWDTAIYVDGTENLIIHTDYSAEPLGGADIVFKHGTSEIMRMVDTDVGIGTTNPTASLHVVGVGYFQADGAQFGSADLVSDAAIVIPEDDFIYTADGTPGSANLRRLIGKQNDAIVIGASGTSLIDEIRFVPGTTWDGTRGFTSFYNNTTEVARFTGDGLGIGTSSPSGALHVFTGTTGNDMEIVFREQGSNIQDIIFKEATVEYFSIRHDGSGASPTNNLIFRAASSTTGIDTDVMTIKQSGNVGIGTTSPEQLLSLVNSSGTLKIQMEGTTSPRNNYIGIQDSDNIVIAADEDDAGGSSSIRFRVDADEKMRIDDSGNVGIGTTSPSSSLHIAGKSPQLSSPPSAGSVPDGSNTLFLTNSDSAYGILVGVLNVGDGYIQSQRVDGTATTYDLLLNPNGGNVGIGETAPDTKLDIGHSSGDAISIEPGSSTDNRIGSTTYSRTMYMAANLTYDGVNNNSGGNASPYTAGNWEYINDNSSNTQGAGLFIIGRNGAGADFRMYSAPGDATAGNPVSTWYELFRTTYNGSTKYTVFNDDGLDMDFRVEASGEPNALFVQGSDGNVGIGTTSPNAKLHVDSGDVLVTGGGGIAIGTGSFPPELTGNDIYLNGGIIAVSVGGSGNIDHIWHDDTNNRWNFVSDGSRTATGNSTLRAGEYDFGTDDVQLQRNGTYLRILSGSTGNYLDIGRGNSSWAHFYANPTQGFYFSGGSHGVVSANGRFGSYTSTDLALSAPYGTTRMTIEYDTGNVGINDTTPSYTLDVNGTFRTTGNAILGDAVTDSHTISGSLNIIRGTTAGVDVLSFDSKVAFNSYDAWLRVNPENDFTSGVWLGSTANLGMSSGYITAGSNGGSTSSRVYIKGGTYNGTNVAYINGDTGTGYFADKVGIATAPATYALSVSGTIASNTDVIVTSDIRLKNELPDTVQGLEAVDKLRPIKYTLKDDEDENPKTHLGFSAQELLDIVPEVVRQADDDGYYSVAYQKLVPVLVKAIQELTEEVRELKKKVGE